MQRFSQQIVFTILFSFFIPVAGGAAPKIKYDKPIVVQVAKVKTGNIPIQIHALGSLSAALNVVISSEVPGRVAKVYFKNGQQVAANMPIIQLDNSKVQADYASAMAALNLSRTKYQRGKLIVNEAISEEALEALKADVTTKEAAVKASVAALDQKQIKAPFAGTLGAFKVQLGDYVNAGDPLVTLTNADVLHANFNVPENEISSLKIGQLVEIHTNAYPKKTFYGTVSFISPTVNAATREIEVQATVHNKKHLLAPGMFIEVIQNIGIKKNILLVLQQAVSADIKGHYVYKFSNHQVFKAYVKVGNQVGEKVEIDSGLKSGEQVVIAGQQKLEDGSHVTIGE